MTKTDRATITFAPLQEAHLPLLVEWLNEPVVRRWWGDGEADTTISQVQEKYIPRIEGRVPVSCFCICVSGIPVGYIQGYWLADFQEYAQQLSLDTLDLVASLDLFIGKADYRQRGLGSLAIKQFLQEFIFGTLKAKSCVLGPSPDNLAAIHAYQNAGFQYLRTIALNGGTEREYLMEFKNTSPAGSGSLLPERDGQS